MISVNNLWKRYGELWALRGLSFEVSPGSVFGLIGPNGAGKTTALRILATSLSPTFGDAQVAGHSAVLDPSAVRPILGFMPERFNLYDDLYVEEYLEFYAGAYHVRRLDRERVVDEVLQLTDMDSKRNELLSGLSKGMRQRVLLAKSLIHDPKVLLLDEPASGLDPRARIELRSVLRTLAQMGKSVIISSHILSELNEMCDSIGIMERGRMIVSGSVAEIEAKLVPSRKVVLRYLGDAEIVQRVLDSDSSVKSFRTSDDRQAEIVFEGGDEEKARIVSALTAAQVGVVDYHETQKGLEDLFLRLSTGGPT